jgi:ABC-2 type transport system permease protein
MIVFRYALLRTLRSPWLVALLLVVPPALLVIPDPPLQVVPIGFRIYGIVLQFTAFLMIRIIVEDREGGVLLRVGAAPITHFRYLGETLLAYALALVVQNILVVGAGVLLRAGSLVSPWRLLAAFAAFSGTAIALCLAICSTLRLREAAYGTCSILIIVLSMLGGGYWPVEMMPDALQRIAMVTPTYWLFNALEAAQQGAAAEGQFALSVGIMVLFTLVLLIAGSKRRIV